MFIINPKSKVKKVKNDFFNWVLLNSHYEARKYKKKKKRMKRIYENCSERAQRKMVSVNSRLKVI